MKLATKGPVAPTNIVQKLPTIPTSAKPRFGMCDALIFGSQTTARMNKPRIEAEDCLQERRRKRHEQLGAQHDAEHRAEHEGQQYAAIDVLAHERRTPGIRADLNHAMRGYDDGGREKRSHDAQQHEPPADAGGRAERRGDEAERHQSDGRQSGYVRR